MIFIPVSKERFTVFSRNTALLLILILSNWVCTNHNVNAQPVYESTTPTTSPSHKPVEAQAVDADLSLDQPSDQEIEITDLGNGVYKIVTPSFINVRSADFISQMRDVFNLQEVWVAALDSESQVVKIS